MSSTELYRIELPYACCGILVNESGVVVEAAPIVGWMKGKFLPAVMPWVFKNHGLIYQVATQESTEVLTSIGC